jgi:hypothetical protein
MHPKILAVVFVALMAGCQRTPSIPKEFNGHFVSDREATIARWRDLQPWGEKTPAMIEKLGPILGSMEMFADGVHYTAISGDWKEEGKTEFLSIVGTTAKVRTYSTVWNRDITSRIEADTTGYWVYSDDPLKGYCERFTRMQPSE